jgi:hypothetical protein
LCRPTGSGFTFDVTTLDFFAADAVVSSSSWDEIFVLERDGTGDVRLSTDAGATWEIRSTGLPADAGVSLFLDVGDNTRGNEPDRLIAVYRAAGAYTSTDAGLSWSGVPNPGLGGAIVVDADRDPGTDRLFLATQDDGVYVSGLGFVNDGLRTRDLTSIAYDATTNSIALGTDHSSVWLMPLADAVASPTAITAAPTQLALRASPNPFMSNVRLDLSIPNDSRSVDLGIFSVDGRRVADLASGPRIAGTHTATWDGRNSDGRAVPPGVYFARLEADGRVASQRVVLLWK